MASQLDILTQDVMCFFSKKKPILKLESSMQDAVVGL